MESDIGANPPTTPSVSSTTPTDDWTTKAVGNIDNGTLANLKKMEGLTEMQKITIESFIN